MISTMSLVPGRGIDFTRLGEDLGLAALVYLLGALFNSARGFSWRASPSARCSACEAKSRRNWPGCPLHYFDTIPMGGSPRGLRTTSTT